MIKVGIVNKSPYPNPEYGKIGNSGMDVKAWIPESITLGPLERVLIPTGIYLDIPEGYEVYSITPYTTKVGNGSTTAGYDVWLVNTEKVKVTAI